MNFHYARYENVKKSVPPKFKNEASDHLKRNIFMFVCLFNLGFHAVIPCAPKVPDYSWDPTSMLVSFPMLVSPNHFLRDF